MSQTGEGTFEAGQYDAAQRGGLLSESIPVFGWPRAPGFRIESGTTWGVSAEEQCAPRLPPTGLDFSASLEMTFGGGPDAVGQEVVGEKLPWHVESRREI